MLDDDTKRRLLRGLLSLVLTAIAARLAVIITNKILGDPDSDDAIV